MYASRERSAEIWTRGQASLADRAGTISDPVSIRPVDIRHCQEYVADKSPFNRDRNRPSVTHWTVAERKITLPVERAWKRIGRYVKGLIARLSFPSVQKAAPVCLSARIEENETTTVDVPTLTYVQIFVKRGERHGFKPTTRGNKSARRFCEYFPVVGPDRRYRRARLRARQQRPTKRVGVRAKQGLIAGALTCVRLALGDGLRNRAFCLRLRGSLPRRLSTGKSAAPFRNLAETIVLLLPKRGKVGFSV